MTENKTQLLDHNFGTSLREQATEEDSSALICTHILYTHTNIIPVFTHT